MPETRTHELVRVTIERTALWTTDAVELGASVADAAAQRLGAAPHDVLVAAVERGERGWALSCVDRTAPGAPRGINLVTALHHLASDRIPPGLHPTP